MTSIVVPLQLPLSCNYLSPSLLVQLSPQTNKPTFNRRRQTLNSQLEQYLLSISPLVLPSPLLSAHGSETTVAPGRSLSQRLQL